MVAATVLAALVSSCSSGEQGIAQPSDSEDVSPDRSVTLAPSSSGSIGTTIDPCELVSAEDIAQYGIFESEAKQLGSARSCFWQRSPEGRQGVSTFSLNVRDRESIDAVKDVGGGLVAGEVNERPAVVAENPSSGSCTVAVKLDETSRIDITITTPPDRDEGSCQFGQDVAYLVEPRLPELP
nr:DUF3558 domain-containing protein [Saccharomonospora piscinae]